MRTRLFIAVLCGCTAFHASAQTTFQKTFGGAGMDYGYSVRQTSDGGYIAAGTTTSFNAGDFQVYLIKTNENGDTLWTKTYGGDGDDFGNSIEQTTDGGFIVGGSTTGFGEGLSDVYLIKTDANGNLIWTKTYGGNDDDVGNAIALTTDGGYIVSGTTSSSGAGNDDVYVVKTDASGNIDWTKTFGGSANDIGNAVKPTSDGGYIVVGNTESFGAGVDAEDVYLIKLDALGDTLWTRTYGGSGFEYGTTVQQTTNGGFVVAGETESFGNRDVYLFKTMSNGNIVWSKTLGMPSVQHAYEVSPTIDNGWIIAGYSVSTTAALSAYLIKTDSNGIDTWSRVFGGLVNDHIRSVQQTSDGGFIAVGTTDNFGSIAGDFYLLKTDANGNSGCNETSAATIVDGTTSATIVSSTSTLISTGGIVNTPPTAVGSGSINSTLCSSVGINETTIENTLTLFPNPATDNVIVTFKESNAIGIVKVISVKGEIIFEAPTANVAHCNFNLKTVSQGLYFVRFVTDTYTVTRKLVVNQY